MYGLIPDVSLTAPEFINKALWPLSSMSGPRDDVAHFITRAVSPQLHVTAPRPPIPRKERRNECSHSAQNVRSIVNVLIQVEYAYRKV